MQGGGGKVEGGMLCREGGGARPRPTWEPFRCSLSLPGIKNPNCRNDNKCNGGMILEKKCLFLELEMKIGKTSVKLSRKIIKLSIITVA